ncbi:hypothetical protein Dda_4408 [Drechslerella dactyloides]|uniref:Uncharacterized protein n=1 Tax=Drechslerella dactyloides TaxID=74499 RepID=A0AAD6NJ33_DREDA|nr:hypothetical protein Dda_4408 [Drechslerella dactyloides]
MHTRAGAELRGIKSYEQCISKGLAWVGSTEGKMGEKVKTKTGFGNTIWLGRLHGIFVLFHEFGPEANATASVEKSKRANEHALGCGGPVVSASEHRWPGVSLQPRTDKGRRLIAAASKLASLRPCVQSILVRDGMDGDGPASKTDAKNSSRGSMDREFCGVRSTLNPEARCRPHSACRFCPTMAEGGGG